MRLTYTRHTINTLRGLLYILFLTLLAAHTSADMFRKMTITIHAGNGRGLLPAYLTLNANFLNFVTVHVDYFMHILYIDLMYHLHSNVLKLL